MTIAIRPYEERDREVAARLGFDSWRSTGLAVAQRVDEAAIQARFAQEVASDWSVYVACDNSDRLVGFLALKRSIGCLDQLFVAPAEQGKGVGSALLNFAKKQMPDGIWLHTAVENGRSCRFYEQSGFKSGEIEIHPILRHQIIVYRWS